MDDPRQPPTQGWSATEEIRKERLGLAILAGCVAFFLLIFAIMFWPAKSQGECMMDMAKKAQGNSTIYGSLVRANCKDLQP